MIQFNKVVGATWLLALGGCSSGLFYNGKGEEIAKHAKSCAKETSPDKYKWAKAVAKQPEYYKFHNYPAGTWKCNLFIADMLDRAGIVPPGTNDEKSITSDGIWAIKANQWQSDVPGWRKVSFQQAGDVVSNGRHCGIAVDSSSTIAAGEKKVYKDDDISGTIQRYDG